MNNKINYFYLKVTDLWKKLCEEHASLLDCTFDEYSFLLGSEIEKLEKNVKNKLTIVERIEQLDTLRKDLINQINKELPDFQIKTVKDLLQMMSEHNSEKNSRHLLKFNSLLEDFIKKIKAQNKRNQLFINKAVLSLKEIKEDALGGKQYSTYNEKGTEKQRNTSF